MTIEPGTRGTSPRRKRTRMVRAYPVHTLEDALTVAATIHETNAGLPLDRVLLARALGTTPASSGYTMKLNSSSKYGLTQGGYNDERISLTPRGESIVAPKGGEERRAALVSAATHPDLFAQFYRKLDGKRLPEDPYAQNMLQREFGTHPDLMRECLDIIKANGLFVGVLRQVDGSLSVDLTRGGDPLREQSPPVDEEDMRPVPVESDPHGGPEFLQRPAGRIFIGHNGDGDAVRFVREVLDQFAIPHAYVDEEDGDRSPVPVRVSEEMRNCTAAVLVLVGPGGADDPAAGRPVDRMLYQLGAASVLYGGKIVVLAEVGLELQSGELSGLHTVEFEPNAPGEAGLSLLRELYRVGAVKVTT